MSGPGNAIGINTWGSRRADQIEGTRHPDVIRGWWDGGRSWNDPIDDTDNNSQKNWDQGDWLYGYGGDDRLLGGAGGDFLDGGDGGDVLEGGTDNDHLRAGDGDDVLKGERGEDRLDGWNGNDDVDGGEGEDKLYGGDGDDRLYGGEGNDWLDAGKGNDKIYGGVGSDRLHSTRGNDLLEGGSGQDTFVFAGGDGRDTILDFQPNDRIELGTYLFSLWDTRFWFLGLGMPFKNADALFEFATVENGDTVFRFYSSDVLIVKNVSDFDQLRDAFYI